MTPLTRSEHVTCQLEGCWLAPPGFITVIVLAQLVCVLEDRCGSAKTEIVAVLQRILRTKQLVVQDAETGWKAVRLFESSTADFADCMIDRIGGTHDCE